MSGELWSSVDIPVKPTFKEHLAQCSKTVASWPRWKRGVLSPAQDVKENSCI